MPTRDERLRVLALMAPNGELGREEGVSPALLLIGARAAVPPSYVLRGAWLAVPHPSRPRLLLPLGPGGARRAGARQYRPSRAIARAAAAGMRGAMWVGSLARRLPLRVAVAVRDDLAEAPGLLHAWCAELAAGRGGEGRQGAGLEDAGALAFAFVPGTPTPFRKDTVVALDGRGRARLRFKVGSGPAPGVRVRHEGAVLERLRGLRAGDVRIAELLGAFSRGEWEALALREEVGKSPLLGGELLRRLAPFTEALHARGAVRGPALEGAFGAALQRRLHRLEHGPARHAQAREALGRAREGLRRDLGGRELPLGWSHGDLAPWNILQGGTGGGEAGTCTVVLDWELASEGTPPLLDLLHLALFQPLQAHRLAPGGLGAHLSRLGARELFAEILSKNGATLGELGPLVRVYLTDRISRLLEDDLLGRDAKRGALIERMCEALEVVTARGVL